MNLLRLSWKNLTFKPLSMSLSIILFALGVGLVSLHFLLEDQLEKNLEKNLASIDLVMLFDPGHCLDKRILSEQFRY